MPMKPNKDESQSDFMSRCVPDMMGDGKRENEQAVAACMNIWRESNKKSRIPVAKMDDLVDVEDDEDEDDFRERCMRELADEGMDADEAADTCQIIWDNVGSQRGVAATLLAQNKIIKSTVSAESSGFDYVLSDASIDRYGDVVESNGWDIKNFAKNPMALFNHNTDAPVGKWKNLRVENGALRGHLELARAGTSARIDEIRALVEQDILRAVSVGFVPIEREPTKKGVRYLKQELLECSLVSVPANPNALQVARSMKISDATMKAVFGEHAVKRSVSTARQPTASKPQPTIIERSTMTALTQRVKDAQARLVASRDKLTAHMEAIDDANVTDADMEVTKGLNEEIDRHLKSYESLRDAEARLATTTSMTALTTAPANGGGGDLALTRGGRPFAMPRKEIKPVQYIFRGLAVAMKQQVEGGRRHVLEVLKETYGEDDMTRQVMRHLITRAATVPADTTTPGWAAELVTTAIGEFFGALQAVSIYPQLAAKGGRFTFGQNGVISIPTRDATPTVAGSFVLQGNPIPVRQGAFSAISLTPKKMAVISTFTREIADHSTPDIEAMIRQAILEDTAASIDSVLLDAVAASATRPAGLLNGVSAIGATGGGGIAGVIGDIKALINALITSSSGNFRSPVWIMSPGDAMAIRLTQAAAGGDMPFNDEIGRGQLMGIPIIQSTRAAADTIYLVDADDFVTATDDAPRFDVSDQATLHMEDTTPLAIGTAGSPNTVAAPVRSLWQTDTLGVRMILPMNWAMRRVGMVQWITGMTWN